MKSPRQTHGIFVAAYFPEDLQVGARAEMLRAAGHDDGLDVGLIDSPAQGRSQRIQQRKADRIDRRRLEAHQRQALGYVMSIISDSLVQPQPQRGSVI